MPKKIRVKALVQATQEVEIDVVIQDGEEFDGQLLPEDWAEVHKQLDEFGWVIDDFNYEAVEVDD